MGCQHPQDSLRNQLADAPIYGRGESTEVDLLATYLRKQGPNQRPEERRRKDKRQTEAGVAGKFIAWRKKGRAGRRSAGPPQ